MRKLNNLLLLCLLFSPATSVCQQFSHSAKLDVVKTTGFHSIPVTAEIASRLDIGLKDLRIIDPSGQQVPYVVRHGFARLKNDYFQPLPIIENTVKDTGSTHLVVQNTTGGHLSQLDLVLRNTATQRTARISGSDDRLNWFIVAENISIPAGEAVEQDRFRVRLDFPRSSYRYLRIIVFNGNSDPLNIMEAGIAGSTAGADFKPLIANPAPTLHQQDSNDGYSYIRVVQPAEYHVAAIHIRLANAKLYKRRLYVTTGSYEEFEISSANDFFDVSPFKAKEFLLKIYNGDNPPLKVAQFLTYQPSRQVVAYLEEGKQYSLLMGSPGVSAPAYDLQSFIDSIPANPAAISIQGISAVTAPQIKKESNRITLWLIIAGVLSLLAYFTWNLTREVSKKQ